MVQFGAVGHTLANVTNGTDGTYYYYLDCTEHPYIAMQFTLSGGSGTVTCTLEASCTPTGTSADATYQDVTSGITGAASFTASRMIWIDTPVPARFLRAKIVAATGGANDGDWRIDVRQVKG